MTRPATYLEATLAVLLLAGGFGWAYEIMTRRDDTRLATLHTHTVVTQVIAAQAETSYTAAKLDAATARALYRSVRDSALRNLGDTAMERRALAKADTAFVHDTITIVKADTAIRKVKDVATSKDAELHEALKPRYSPRLTTTIAALYDPLGGSVSGAGAISIRVLGPVSLVARVEQRPILERPSVRLGVAITF